MMREMHRIGGLPREHRHSFLNTSILRRDDEVIDMEGFGRLDESDDSRSQTDKEDQNLEKTIEKNYDSDWSEIEELIGGVDPELHEREYLIL